jgi:[acyl-carrier-protein] S-malonyltransferase
MRFAMIFPGQGSQSVGMLSTLAEHSPTIRRSFAEASEVLGYDLWQLASSGPQDLLDSTERTQPVMLAAGVAVWRVWMEQGTSPPAMMAGHSLGEYTALVCAGALEFADALRLVERRGQLMQSAVPPGVGAMAAIVGLDDDSVRETCNTAAEGETVEAVNFNAPGQVVIAGHAAAVARAVELASQRGAKLTKVLPVSVPSHCSLMRPAAERLSEYLQTVRIIPPTVPVIHNVDASTRSDPDSIRMALVRQLHSPVEWVQTVQAMTRDGAGLLLECGPGNVLAGLCRRINRAIPAIPMQDVDGLNKALGAVTTGGRPNA